MAIILSTSRPALDASSGTFAPAPEVLGGALEVGRAWVEGAIRAVGCVCTDNPQVPHIGTAFLAGPKLVITTRHVARVFVDGKGDAELSLTAAMKPWVSFGAVDGGAPLDIPIVAARFIHPYWDMALFELAAAPQGIAPLELEGGEDPWGRDIVIVGYPYRDLRNDVALQERIFEGVFEKKAVMPGRTRRGKADGISPLFHDASTLGGTTGGPLVDLATGRVIGVHFAGSFLETNYAVPVRELFRDPRVRRHQIAFADPPWMQMWNALAPEVPVSPPAPRFTPDELLAMRILLINLGFFTMDRIRTLLLGLSPMVAASAPTTGDTPGAALLEILYWLNRMPPEDGYHPLYLVLRHAEVLSPGATAEQGVALTGYLARVPVVKTTGAPKE